MDLVEACRLIGLAVDPSFATNGFFYLSYTYENNAATYSGPVADVQPAYDYSGATYDFYKDRFGRDLFVRMMLAGRLSLLVGVVGLGVVVPLIVQSLVALVLGVLLRLGLEDASQGSRRTVSGAPRRP